MNHIHADCKQCPNRAAHLKQAGVSKRHATKSTPEVTVNVTAHNLIVVTGYPMRRETKSGTFLSDIKAAVQYGKSLQAMVIAFNTVGTVNVNRTHEILSGVFNIPLATGTIKNMATRCLDSLGRTYEKIRLSMIALGLFHCDETDTCVDVKTCWVHDIIFE